MGGVHFMGRAARSVFFLTRTTSGLTASCTCVRSARLFGVRAAFSVLSNKIIMAIQRTLLARAVLSAFAVLSAAAQAQTEEKTLPSVVVTATPFNSEESAQIIAPAKVLSGPELRNKLGVSLGDTLSHELGVSASAFGAGASRPIIRGLEGPRIKILQDGMSVSDVSSLSNDHAVTAEASTARQIEILRGPATLLYGSGAIGGLVNVVNDRIPTELLPRPSGETELRAGSVNHERSLSFSADGASGSTSLHLDGSARNTGDQEGAQRQICENNFFHLGPLLVWLR